MQNLTLAAGASEPLSLIALLLNLAVGAVLGVVIRWHFQRFGSTLSNRGEFAIVFPFVLLTTVLIITVVKSSLALSLGLVGALSIVRFRTPIKEPEELAYLFITIAIGLGLGANQTLITITAALFILAAMAYLSKNRQLEANKNLYLTIDWHGEDNSVVDNFLGRLDEIMKKHATDSDLRRYDVRDGSLDITYFVDVPDTKMLSTLTKEIQDTFPNTGVTFIDQNQLPSI
jgi:hypothetical protein